MKALCLVAHPDDCVIFAYSYIHNHPEMSWTICYLTYTVWDDRGREVNDFWKQRGIPCVFLGHIDDYHDLENKQISFDTEQAKRQIKTLINDYDLVLTHDQYGDYGHIHHVFAHDCVQSHPNIVEFAGIAQGNVSHSVPANTYCLSELPLCGDLVKTFFPNGIHQNNYTEPHT